ncbi:predicted protein [Botrytis cinerea T4]|uniref:Uncharacterized protein n=1 Tax=Botryotinia fuckeliana (strain T4) TaxID=999810 RepID=G2YS39_BOTF4|nr:predicted protein [Botrytis cinerea T4]
MECQFSMSYVSTWLCKSVCDPAHLGPEGFTPLTMVRPGWEKLNEEV